VQGLNAVTEFNATRPNYVGWRKQVSFACSNYFKLLKTNPKKPQLLSLRINLHRVFTLAWIAFTSTLNIMTRLRYYHLISSRHNVNIFPHSYLILRVNRYRYSNANDVNFLLVLLNRQRYDSSRAE